MEVLWKAEDLLCDKIEEVIQQGDISPTEMDNIYKAIKSIYYIEATCAMIEASEDEYSDSSFESMNSSRRGGGSSGRRSSYASYAQGQGGGGSSNRSSNRSSMARGRSYAGRGYSTHDKKEMMLQRIAEMEREIENME